MMSLQRPLLLLDISLEGRINKQGEDIISRQLQQQHELADHQLVGVHWVGLHLCLLEILSSCSLSLLVLLSHTICFVCVYV
jgi:hypothetical protein